MRKITALLVLLTLIEYAPALAQDSLTGNWEGAIQMQETELTIITHFDSTEEGYQGTIDIPQQGAQNIPLQNISISNGDSVQFEFMGGPGLASFEGSIQGDTITGTLHQNNQTFPFELYRQQQQAEKPYHHKEMTIKKDSVTIGGTLTWPKDTKSSHLVIMIFGSGQQDRDGTMTPVTNFKPYATLAGSLSTNGIATFRYDDRGVGKSTGNFGNATLDMLTSDVEAIINELKAMPEHNFEQIILFGHSQGGMVAGELAAEYSGIDKVILMASPGVSFKEVLRFQVKQIFESAGIPDSLTSVEIKARERLMKALYKNKNVEQAKAHYQEQLRDRIDILSPPDNNTKNPDSIVKKEVTSLISAYSTPQMQSLLFYDPADDLHRLDIPVLVLFGDKDTQVTIEMNKAPIKQALESAGVSYQIKTFEDANHLFQEAKTGKMQEYGKLKKQFVDSFTSTIAEWVKK